MKKYNILVTGLSGYIASNLVKKLLLQGNKVFALTTKNFSSEDQFETGLKVYYYDGSFSSVDYAFRNNNIDFVFHLASVNSYNQDIKNIESSIDCNIKYGSYLLEAMSNNSCKYLINTGTYWQYSTYNKAKPICFYAATKQAFEDIIDYYVLDKNLSTITLNLPDTYGPNDNRKKIFSLIKESYKNNCEVNLTDGKQLMDFLYIEDVLEGYLAAMNVVKRKTNLGKHEKYFLTSGTLKSLKEVILKYIEITGWKVVVNWGAVPYRKNQIMKPYIGKVLPNWKPKFDLDKGLKNIAYEK
ncbi:MAG: NAD-dependent epimerase/dehydratase family protein [Pelagibacterales bacterium]|nr:NAD-dependent epimerase/dehydratase family protein [Pelagibacterales bacterium]